MLTVSIATISYNQGQFLEQAICSVLNQGYPNLELIIIDPGSTDGSREIIERYRGRIKCIIYERDAGPADGLNRCFERADGAIFGYLNADDLLLPNAITYAVNALVATNADVVYGDGYIINESGKPVRHCLSTAFDFERFALGSVTVLQQSTFFRRDAFIASPGFNVENRTCWDYELLYDFATMGKHLVHIPQCWSMFRIHSGSITGSHNNAAEYRKDRERIAGNRLARYGRWLPLVQAAARLEKHLANPRSVMLRAIDYILPPPSTLTLDSTEARLK